MKRTHDYKRSERVSELVQRKLAEIIQLEVKDPRLPRFVTVSHVAVTDDMAIAKVYVTVLGDKKQALDAVEVLNSAASYLRTVLARSIKLRIVPKLIFAFDETLEYGNRLSRLIDDANLGTNQQEPSDDES